MTSYNTNLPRSTLGFTIPIVTKGTTTAVSNIGTTPVAAIAQNSARQSITFINPNVSLGINLFVAQATDVNGNALTPGDGHAGSIPLLPGAILLISGQCQCAWNVVAATGSTSGLTIIESDNPPV